MKKFKIVGELNEARYTQFRKETAKRSAPEQLHKAIKEIQIRLDEVAKLVDFTSRIKGELQENSAELQYLRRTENSLVKIGEKLGLLNEKIKELTQ